MMRVSFLAALGAVACYATGARAPETPGQPAASPVHVVVPVPAVVRDVVAGPTSAPPVDTAPQAPLARDESAPCPAEMALVERPQGAFCIDRWEASLVERRADGSSAPWPGNRTVDGRDDLVAISVAGQKPQTYISGAEAERACSNAGKRLCELDEWVRACRGPHAHTYPYGDRRAPDRCNDRYKVLDDHPVVALFDRSAPPGTDRKRMWSREWMNDPRLYDMPRGIAPTGSFPDCRSEYGAYDLVGNVHEWIADPDGTFVGGFFMDTFQNGEGCGYRTRAHDFGYHDYSTGFRCCRDASAPENARATSSG